MKKRAWIIMALFHLGSIIFARQTGSGAFCRCSIYSYYTRAMASKTKPKPSHYQVLGIEQDASSKDVRDAFLKLSKFCHPDINSKDPSNHDKFVKINEAYSVLSKPLLRRDYDNDLLIQWSSPDISYRHKADGFQEQPYYHERPDYDPQFYAYRDKSQDEYYMKKPYYGVGGISKVSNRIIVYTCVAIILIGAVFHYFVVKKLSDITIETLNDRDRKTHQIWLNANDPNYISEQVKLMKVKIKENGAKNKNRD